MHGGGWRPLTLVLPRFVHNVRSDHLKHFVSVNIDDGFLIERKVFDSYVNLKAMSHHYEEYFLN